MTAFIFIFALYCGFILARRPSGILVDVAHSNWRCYPQCAIRATLENKASLFCEIIKVKSFPDPSSGGECDAVMVPVSRPITNPMEGAVTRICCTCARHAKPTPCGNKKKRRTFARYLLTVEVFRHIEGLERLISS